MAELDLLRSRIDELDEALIDLLARRFEVSRRIGEIKRASALAARDEDREAQQRARMRALAARAGLSPELAEAVLQLIVDRVVEEHQRA